MCNKHAEWTIHDKMGETYSCTDCLSIMVSDSTTVIEPYGGETIECCCLTEREDVVKLAVELEIEKEGRKAAENIMMMALEMGSNISRFHGQERRMLGMIVGQLESCGYECEAGPLRLNTAFITLRELAKPSSSDV